MYDNWVGSLALTFYDELFQLWAVLMPPVPPLYYVKMLIAHNHGVGVIVTMV